MDVVALGELLIDFACVSADAEGYPTMAAHPGGAPANFLAALAKFGAKTEVLENSIIVHPSSLSAPNEPLNAHNDHRIVMALATLCTITGGTIVNAQAVEKSFPEYFQVISSLGVSLKEV